MYYGINHVRTYSGGTEATAFHPNAVTALRHAGLVIRTVEEKPNPVYEVSASADQPAWQAYSKRFDDPANPTANFCAVMVCTDADQNCPVVPGAEKRISLPYQDPKAYDNTPEATVQYNNCCRQIAREMFYVIAV